MRLEPTQPLFVGLLTYRWSRDLWCSLLTCAKVNTFVTTNTILTHVCRNMLLNLLITFKKKLKKHSKFETTDNGLL